MASHPHIHANYVPSFTNNLIGISPIIDRGAVGIIQSNKMTLVKRSRLVDKILNFVLKYSTDNNLIILTGDKSKDLYITDLKPNMASLSVASRHLPSLKEMVYYFYLVFNCPNIETYCQLLNNPTLSGFPQTLTSKTVRKYYPHNDHIRSISQLSKQPVHAQQIHVNQSTICGEIVELDKLLINTPSSKMPLSNGGFNHVLLAVDSYRLSQVK